MIKFQATDKWYRDAAESESGIDEISAGNIKMFSVNGVPYPHDEWLKLTGQMTVSQCVELCRRWYVNKKIT